MDWYWYIAVFFAAAYFSFIALILLLGADKPILPTEEERRRINDGMIMFSNFIIIGLIAVIIVFLFVEIK